MLNDSFFNPFLFGSYYDNDRNYIYQRHLQAEEERQRRIALQRQQEQRRIMLEQERRRKQQQLDDEIRQKYLRQMEYEQYVKDLERKKKLRQQQQLQQQRQEQQRRLMRSPYQIYNDSQYDQDDFNDMEPGMVFQGPDGRFYRVVNKPNNAVNYKLTTNCGNDELMKDTVVTKAEKPTKTTTTKSTTTTVTKEQLDHDHDDPHQQKQPSPPSIHNVTYNNCFNRVLEETHHHHGDLDGELDGIKVTKNKTNKKKTKSKSRDNFRNNRGTLIGGVEDASDDESDDNSVWVNRRPSDGQWMEPVDGYEDTIII